MATIGGARKAVVADPELDGGALRDSCVRMRIAEEMCSFGHGRAGSMVPLYRVLRNLNALLRTIPGATRPEPHRNRVRQYGMGKDPIMTSPAAPNYPMRLSTDAFPEAVRLSAWREIYGRN